MSQPMRLSISLLVAALVAGCGARTRLTLHGAGGLDGGVVGDAGGGQPDGRRPADGNLVDGPRDGSAVTLTALGVSPALVTAGIRTTVAFTATGSYSDGSRRDLTAMAAWSSSSPMVATVMGGTARTVAAGTAVIRAMVMGLSGAATLNVTGAALTALTVDPARGTIPIGAKLALHATGLYADGSKQDLTDQATWTSADAGTASVTSGVGGGVVTGVKAGTVMVSVSFQGQTVSASITVTTARAVSLEISPANPILSLPASQQFTAIAIYDDGSKGNVTTTVAWESSDQTVLDVSTTPGSQGLATARGPGTSIVTARLGMVTATTAVTVTPARLTGIQVQPGGSTIPRGTTAAFTATGTFADGTTADVTGSVTWSSSDETVATVSNTPGSQGVATGLKVGGTAITATLSGLSGAAKLSVTDATVTALAVAPRTSSIAVGARAQLTATATYSDGTQKDVTASASWSASDPSVAVSSGAGTAGQVTGIKIGGADVTASFSGKSATARVTVTAATLTQITVTPRTLALVAGLKQNLTATATYSDGSTLDVTGQATWSTDDAMVATASNAMGTSGLVTAVGPGTTTVHARLDGKDGTATVTVTAATLKSLSVSPILPSRRVGQNVQFGASAILSNGTSRNVTLQATWTSSAPMVATIVGTGGNRGQASCVGPGTTTITAMYMGQTDSTVLTCSQATAKELQVTPFVAMLQVGQSVQLVATLVFSDGSTQNVTGMATWSSSNPMAAPVSNQNNRGQVTGVAGPGMATITATFMGFSATAQVTVTPAVLTRVSVAPVLANLRVRQNQQFTATAIFSDGSTRNVTGMATWSSSDPRVAGVSNRGGGGGGGGGGGRGQVTGLMPGMATITATFMGLADTATVVVSAPKLTALSVSPVSPTIQIGQQQPFTATAIFDDGSTQNVTGQAVWSSDNPMVADVAAGGPGRGTATGLAAGTATISATYMGTSDASRLTVSGATLTALQVTPVNPTLPKGLQQPFQAVGIYSDNTSRDVTNLASWVSSMPAVADVSSGGGGGRGLVTTLTKGTTDITATLSNVSGSSQLTVTDAVIVQIQVTPTSPTLPGGGVSQPFQAVALYSDMTTRDITALVTWESSDPIVAEISNAAGSRGLATTLGSGSATIKATLMGLSGSTMLTVTDATLAGIVVTPAMASIAVRGTQQFTAIGKYSDGSTLPLTDQVTWISSAPTTVAAISNATGSRGLATGVGMGGTATIEAHFQGMTGTATLVVTP
jgi:hypothetical protein